MDSSLLTTCRVTGLTKTVGNASEFRVCWNCGGYTHETVGSLRKTQYDLTENNVVVDPTPVDITEDNLLTRDGYRCSHCGEKLTNYEALSALATSCHEVHDAAVEGTDPGEYAVGSKATFHAVITTSQNLVSAEAQATTQEDVDAQVDTLQTALATFEAGIVPEP